MSLLQVFSETGSYILRLVDLYTMISSIMVMKFQKHCKSADPNESFLLVVLSPDPTLFANALYICAILEGCTFDIGITYQK